MPPEGRRRVHLDPIGGAAGDMVVACLLDVFPEHEPPLQAALAGLGLPDGVRLRRIPHRDHALAGSRVTVEVPAGSPPSGHWSAIRDRLARAALPEGARARALAIYGLLAVAEAAVHGVPVGDVHFHELADWDSYVDIVAAAWLIDRVGAASWSTAPLPLGSGRVRTQHGSLPVPAPATARLLAGLPVLDDGIAGERVTPTGAAILRHLAPSAAAAAGRIVASGHGFGSRRLDGLPNLLRALVIDDDGPEAADRIGVIRFEVDDQTAEDLAIGLDRLRKLPAVRDVCQWPAFGKKGRMLAAVQVLCDSGAVEQVADRCLAETTSIGLRWRIEARRVLPRRVDTSAGVRRKQVTRPDGSASIKAEADDLAGAGDHIARQRLRQKVERGESDA